MLGKIHVCARVIADVMCRQSQQHVGKIHLQCISD